MKKILAALSSLLLIGAFAFAEGSLSANDLQVSDSITDSVEVNGFTITADKEKEVRVKASTKAAPDGTKFTKRIDLRGTGKTDYRSISFTAKAGETITVYANSGSKTDDRAVQILNAKGKVLSEFTAAIYVNDISVGEFKAPADGKYYVRSKSGGMYIYGITVK